MNKTVISIGATVLLLGGGGTAYALSTGGSQSRPTSQAVTALSQPTLISQIARSLKATRVTNCGPAPAGGVTDEGVAYLGSKKIGIDTFPSPDIRDGWKKMSADFGIVPFAEGNTWVAYKAIDQAAGC